MFAAFSSNDPKGQEEMRRWNAGMVDQCMRQAVESCWSSLPPDKRTVKELKKQVRRIMERAIKHLREDNKAFGIE
jgi:hypothetical protein